jgi:hypothetical protein
MLNLFSRKSIFLLAVAAIMSTAMPAVAQNIKNERVSVKYLRPPQSPFRTDAKGYRISVDVISPSSEDSSDGIARAIKSNAKLYGEQFTEVQSGADIEIHVRLDRFSAENPRVESKQVTTEKSDKTKVTVTVYTGYTSLAYPMFVRIRDIKEDKTLYEGFVNNSDQYSSRETRGFSTSKEARTELDQIIKNAKRESFNAALSSLESLVTSKFSFYPTNHYWSINYVETSKKVNYDDLVTAKDATKKVLDSLSNKSLTVSETAKADMVKAIDLWQNILKEADLEDRKARIDKKVSQAILENLAYCNFFIRNFTEAEKYMQLAKERNKQQWQFDLAQQIADMKQRLEANSVTYQ